jgi:hypothetical protein
MNKNVLKVHISIEIIGLCIIYREGTDHKHFDARIGKERRETRLEENKREKGRERERERKVSVCSKIHYIYYSEEKTSTFQNITRQSRLDLLLT